MAEDLIRYDILAQDALRGVVRKVLSEVARTGLAGRAPFLHQLCHEGARRPDFEPASGAISRRNDDRPPASVSGTCRSPSMPSRSACPSTMFPSACWSPSPRSRASSIRRFSSACNSTLPCDPTPKNPMSPLPRRRPERRRRPRPNWRRPCPCRFLPRSHAARPLPRQKPRTAKRTRTMMMPCPSPPRSSASTPSGRSKQIAFRLLLLPRVNQVILIRTPASCLGEPLKSPRRRSAFASPSCLERPRVTRSTRLSNRPE